MRKGILSGIKHTGWGFVLIGVACSLRQISDNIFRPYFKPTGLFATVQAWNPPGFQKPFCFALTDVADLVQLFKRNYWGI
jgi:hypothetical protein